MNAVTNLDEKVRKKGLMKPSTERSENSTNKSEALELGVQRRNLRQNDRTAITIGQYRKHGIIKIVHQNA